jgi:recombination protein U
MTKQESARYKYQNTVNNARGHDFEEYILSACNTYKLLNRAVINKTPEPFLVTSKQSGGIFTGRFTALAQPDFQGTLVGGRSIVFEAKYTTTDRLKRGILTDNQMDVLSSHADLGAVTGVCAGICDKFYFIPWLVWRDMKDQFGRLYVKAEDVEQYRVRFTGAVMFLDYIHYKEM